ncbi:hypothetical protein [Parafrankia sp. Ea1.12]|nr:hypothetical protein [Parafrankia sp. Ea1.12]
MRLLPRIRHEARRDVNKADRAGARGLRRLRRRSRSHGTTTTSY